MTVGSRLGRYELLARIATGGMGEIFLARLEGAAGFEKLCVIKRILPHLADDARFRAMLIGEARIASNMSHANICHVYELDESDHQLYMVMEYLEGATLLQLLHTFAQSERLLDYGFVAGVVQQACEGLHYAHELRDRNGASLGVVHRDVTPSNLFLTKSGVVKIVDFGIAKVKDAANTESGAVKGKYAYMAPEQLRGQTVDHRVDVFSLGVVVVEMLTCRRLYQRKTDYLTFRAVMEQPMIDIRQHRPDAPDRLTAVLQRALERDPAARWPTVRQFGSALLDAFGDIRPWGQREISELVNATFADDLALHDAEVSDVIKRAHAEQLRSIPLISRRTPDADGSDYFAMETHEPGPLEHLEFDPHSDGGGSGFGQAGVGPRSQPLPMSLPPSRPAPARRWNALPTAGILGGAVAVLVVGLVLVGGSRDAPVPAAPAAAAPPPPPERPRPDRARRGPGEPYAAAIHGHERALDQCARTYLDSLPANARAVLVIGVDGRARQIALEPESTDRSKLGGCVRDVLQVVTFPAAPDEKQVALGLTLYR